MKRVVVGILILLFALVFLNVANDYVSNKETRSLDVMTSKAILSQQPDSTSPAANSKSIQHLTTSHQHLASVPVIERQVRSQKLTRSPHNDSRVTTLHSDSVAKAEPLPKSQPVMPNLEQTSPHAQTNNASFKQSTGLDWSSIPGPFVQQFKEQGIPVDAYYKKNALGHYKLLISDSGKMVIAKPERLLKKLPLTSAAHHYLQSLLTHGFPVNQAIDCSPSLRKSKLCENKSQIFLANLDLTSLTLKLELGHALFRTQSKEGRAYLPNTTQRYVSSVLDYDLNFSKNYNVNQSQAASLNLHNVTGFGQTHLTTDAYLGNVSSFDNLTLAHDFKKHAASVGYQNSSHGFGNANTGSAYGYSGSAVVASWYSSNNLLIDKPQSALTPITLFVSQRSQVRVYRNNRLLSVQQFAMGMNQVDTRRFPGGNYPVKIDIYQGNQLVKSLTRMVNKPFDISALDPDSGWAYSFWAGSANTEESASFNQPYLGFALRKVINPHVFSGLSAYSIGSLGVVELDNQLILPKGVTGNVNMASDTRHGSALSMALNKSFPGYGSVALSYNRTNRSQDSEFSPFQSSSSSLNVSGSVSLGVFGSLNAGADFSLSNHTASYNAGYNTTLYQKNGLSINGALMANKTVDNTSSQSSNIDYTASVTLNYTFDNSDSVNLSAARGAENQMSYNGNYHHSFFKDSPFNDVTAGFSSYNDSRQTYGTLTMNHPAITGAFYGNATQDATTHAISHSLGGSLHGAMALTSSGLALNGKKGDSGLMVNMDIPDNQKMNLNINDTSYQVHAGQNYIPLSNYESYRAYLLSGAKSDSFYWTNKEEDFTLFPGNIYSAQWKAVPVVHVLGQLMQGEKPAAQAKVDNHLAPTYTDAQGFFMTSLDKNKPTLTFTLSDGTTCHYRAKKEELQKMNNGNWLGTIQCAP
ncbi:TcfC E-set like domain-containing protein [Vibrio sp. S4M6]|uniref:TcfC E-set like domain-containing protein n=1 Tax=Vibrio sinus TaxID=2946865 RepID=UPI00202A6031|nr:TcfC E-set like domain-containing protein [Vibrio sinus]MCL9781320.1 TcfC E-set like domain-containing protein [Vibrio sinus]